MDILADEIKDVIKRYIALPYEIAVIKNKIETIRASAYSSQSFTGVSKYGHSIDDYQHAVNIENFVIELVMIQDSLHRQLQRVSFKYRRFCNYYPSMDLPTVKTLLKHDILTNYEMDIYQAIQQVDSDLIDYDKEHRQTIPQETVSAYDDAPTPNKSKLAYLMDYLEQTNYADDVKKEILENYIHQQFAIS